MIPNAVHYMCILWAIVVMFNVHIVVATLTGGWNPEKAIIIKCNEQLKCMLAFPQGNAAFPSCR